MIDALLLKELQVTPVFESPTCIRYMRASDIPDTVRPAFERWAAGSGSPSIPGEMPGDPIHEADYIEWLRSLRS
jgi:hypothetical protein